MTYVWRQRLVHDDLLNGFGNKSYLKPFDQWLEESFQANKPWDKIVSEILTLEGKESPVRAFYQFDTQFANVEQFTNKVGQYFLGIQLQCAQCHNHPHTKQLLREDYWGLAAFFSKMSGTALSEEGKQTEPRSKPDGYRLVSARFLHGDEAKLGDQERRRPALAQWLTAPGNPYFARAFVNRTWAHFFGRGLIQPVDDIAYGKEASHPALLDELTRQFIASGFDIRFLEQAICSSNAYQRGSRRPKETKDDGTLYSYALIRNLSPRQLYLSRGAIARGVGFKEKDFLNVFDLAVDLEATILQTGILEQLRLLNSASVNSGDALLAKLIRADQTPEQNVAALYLAVLSRRPTEAESRRAVAYLRQHNDLPAACADLFWALLNSAEFQLNH